MFSPIKNTKVYEQVMNQIQEMIEKGTLKKGDKLPSERDLVEQLQVSRASIREALRALEVIGLIECRQGEGNFIKSSFQDNLFEPLSIMFLLEGTKPKEILELRKTMEVEASGLAAERIKEEQLNDLKKIMERFENCENEEMNAVIDKEFHYKIAEYSGNVLIFNILRTVSLLVEDFIKDARKLILAQKENKEMLLSQHREIYLTIEERDPDKARNAMREHLNYISMKYNNII